MDVPFYSTKNFVSHKVHRVYKPEVRGRRSASSSERGQKMQIKSALLFNSDIRLPISDFYFLNSARDKKLNHKKSRENVHGLFEIQKKRPWVGLPMVL